MLKIWKIQLRRLLEEKFCLIGQLDPPFKLANIDDVAPTAQILLLLFERHAIYNQLLLFCIKSLQIWLHSNS